MTGWGKVWLGVIWYLAKIFIGFYLGLFILLVVFQRFIVFPGYLINEQLTPRDTGVPEMQVFTTTTEDGLKLEGWFAPPKDSAKPVVVMFYGQGDSAAHLSGYGRFVMDHGYGALFVNYRGFDGNPGFPSEQGLYKDARAQINYITQQGYNNLAFFGVSLGTGIAVKMATEYPSKAVILQSPYASVVDVAAQRFWFYPVRAVMLDKIESINIIDRINAPLLVFMGDKDNVIPPSQAVKLFEQAKAPKKFIWVRGKKHEMSRGDIFPPMLEFLSQH